VGVSREKADETKNKRRLVNFLLIYRRFCIEPWRRACMYSIHPPLIFLSYFITISHVWNKKWNRKKHFGNKKNNMKNGKKMKIMSLMSPNIYIFSLYTVRNIYRCGGGKDTWRKFLALPPWRRKYFLFSATTAEIFGHHARNKSTFLVCLYYFYFKFRSKIQKIR
jgi:hypothetical protein